ncbi:hypothetical protein PC118_g9576 [Phytophthora cactorum]|uniref:Uncharacterized protein n=1 Tax=Phytophthora cactorum TaxID=29920 RepID=A0A8T1G2L6_9STRA|nr:hypothetical protein PC118_g9576 [Phytophthora cactorum]
MTLIGIYPLYKVLYSHVPLAYRSIVVIILPIWKFAAKSFVARSSRQLEDYIPELAASSVDFFGTLFVSSKCAFSPLYQLAFVLETQMCPVQVHLFVALIILLQC